MAKRKKEFQKDASILQTYLHNGVDLDKRRISFGDIEYAEGNDFEFSSVTTAIRGIDKLLDLNNKKAIEIHMNSYGGDPYQMLALKDKILESGCKFKFYGRGAIMSAATWIMAICDERYLSADTQILVHKGWTSIAGPLTDAEIAIEEEKRLQKLLEQIYADNSYMPLNFWHDICKRDLSLSADEAIKLGLADAIIPPKKRGKFRQGVRSHTIKNPPTKKEIRKISEILFERIQAKVPKNLIIEIKKDEFEEIEEYDNTQEELEKLGLPSTTKDKEE